MKSNALPELCSVGYEESEVGSHYVIVLSARVMATAVPVAEMLAEGRETVKGDEAKRVE